MAGERLILITSLIVMDLGRRLAMKLHCYVAPVRFAEHDEVDVDDRGLRRIKRPLMEVQGQGQTSPSTHMDL